MDIDKILQDLIDKYDIDYNQSNYKKAVVLINQLMNEIPLDARIAIRGRGEHTEKLLEAMEEGDCKRDFVCIIDNDLTKKNNTKYDLISMDKIDEYNIDVIIISSYSYRIDMEIELYNLDRKYKVIDIYDYFSVNDLELQTCFYNIRYYNYDEVFCNRKKYLNEDNYKLKEFYLKKLIISYLNIRDFLYATKYINEYIESEYSKAYIYKKFLQELNLFFEGIKNKIEQREHKDIIMNWLDAVRFDELSKMKYLSRISEDSMFFENAFTMTPWTSSTMYNIMTNKKTIDDYLFNMEKIDDDNSCVLKLFKDNKYNFKYIGDDRGEKLFDEKFLEKGVNCFCTTNYYWILLKNLLMTDMPYFFIIHTLYETHTPFISGNLEKFKYYYCAPGYWPQNGWEDIELKQQQSLARKYVDEQLEWYNQFLNYNCYKIYMSDHGAAEASYKDGKLHTILFVENSDFISTKCKKLFSYINFYKLFNYILDPNNENFKNMFSLTVELQALDYYNEGMVKRAIEQDGTLFEFCDALSYRGVRTEYDKYILYNTGDERYFILPNEDDNRIGDSKYNLRIDELRTLAGSYFVDIYKCEKFKYSRKLYDTLKNQKIDIFKKILKI